MEQEIELLLQVFASKDATLNETKEALLLLCNSSLTLPSRQKHTDEMFKKLKYREKTENNFKGTDKEMYYTVGWLDCFDALKK